MREENYKGYLKDFVVYSKLSLNWDHFFFVPGSEQGVGESQMNKTVTFLVELLNICVMT